MNPSQASLVLYRLGNYRRARRFGWLTLCVFQFLLIVPAILLVLCFALREAAEAFWVEVRDRADINLLAFTKPEWRDAEKDALLAEALAATPEHPNNGE